MSSHPCSVLTAPQGLVLLETAEGGVDSVVHVADKGLK